MILVDAAVDFMIDRDDWVIFKNNVLYLNSGRVICKD